MVGSGSGTGRPEGSEASRSEPLPLRLVEGGVKAATCKRCHRSVALTDAEICLWWPNGCAVFDGKPRQPRPTVCWSCTTEEERADLVDGGCVRAIIEVRSWS